jgi:hypothetical protein
VSDVVDGKVDVAMVNSLPSILDLCN